MIRVLSQTLHDINLLATDELISKRGGLLISWDETLDLMVIVISHIWTLWLKLGFYSSHCESNTITDNYNRSFCKKNWRPFRFPKRVRTLKSDKNYGRYNIKRTGTPKNTLYIVIILEADN